MHSRPHSVPIGLLFLLGDSLPSPSYEPRRDRRLALVARSPRPRRQSVTLSRTFRIGVPVPRAARPRRARVCVLLLLPLCHRGTSFPSLRPPAELGECVAAVSSPVKIEPTPFLSSLPIAFFFFIFFFWTSGSFPDNWPFNLTDTLVKVPLFSKLQRKITGDELWASQRLYANMCKTLCKERLIH